MPTRTSVIVAREVVPPWMVVQTGVGLGEASGLGVGLGLEAGEAGAEAISLGVGVCVFPPTVADPQPASSTHAASNPRYFMLQASPPSRLADRVNGHSFWVPMATTWRRRV
jgi:hypothetical protein